MLTIIFNGSPHPNGDTASLIEEFLKHLKGDVIKINAYSAGIHPCIDCRNCFQNMGCSQKDDMDGIYENIRKADNLIIASPLYFSELTGPLLALFSRLQTFWVAKFIRNEELFLRKKRGGVFLVGGGDGSMDKAKDTATCLLHIMGADVLSVVTSLNTDHLPSCEDAMALENVRELATAFNAK